MYYYESVITGVVFITNFRSTLQVFSRIKDGVFLTIFEGVGRQQQMRRSCLYP